MAGRPTVYRSAPCIVCGRVSVVPLPAPIAAGLSSGLPLQELLPELPRAEREQMISGTHPDCWAAYFGDDEERD